MRQSTRYRAEQRHHSIWALLGIGVLIFTLALVAIPACIVGGLMQAASYDPGPNARPKITITNQYIVAPTAVPTPR